MYVRFAAKISQQENIVRIAALLQTELPVGKITVNIPMRQLNIVNPAE